MRWANVRVFQNDWKKEKDESGIPAPEHNHPSENEDADI